MDPTRRRSGGALLGDRIRMNSLAAPNVFMRSLATRRQHLATSAVLKDVIALYRAAGFDLIVVETAGIGQSDTEIVDLVDLSLYVMTTEYGAASQLEKIDMLDFADMIVLNKFEKRGAEDALRDVRKQWRRNHPDRMKLPDEEVPVFPDHRQPLQRSGRQSPVPGAVRARSTRKRRDGPLDVGRWRAARRRAHRVRLARSADSRRARSRYLAEIARAAARRTRNAERRADAARRAHGLYLSLQALRRSARCPAPLDRYPAALDDATADATRRAARRLQPRRSTTSAPKALAS